jgi:hypothetical protein
MTTNQTPDGQGAALNRQFLTTLANLGIASHRLDQIRDAARLHRQQLIGTSELYAVIEADTAAAVSSVGQAPATDQTALRDRIAAAIWERQNPGRHWADCEYRWQADAEADADAVLAVLPAHSDLAAVLLWAADQIDAETQQAKADGVLEPDKFRPCRDASAQLRRLAVEAAVPGRRDDETAEADVDGEALRAKVEEATATLRRVRSALRTLKDQGATGRTYHQVITDALAGPRPDAPAVGGAQQPKEDRP